jgi:hypothetical protein
VVGVRVDLFMVAWPAQTHAERRGGSRPGGVEQDVLMVVDGGMCVLGGGLWVDSRRARRLEGRRGARCV